MQTQVQITGRFTFNADGFFAPYSYKGQSRTLTLCPTSLCRLLTAAGQIEGFDMDENNEPVILFTEPDPVKYAYGFDRWNSFFRTFPISLRMAEKLIEFWESREEHADFQVTVNRLLAPAMAAA